MRRRRRKRRYVLNYGRLALCTTVLILVIAGGAWMGRRIHRPAAPADAPIVTEKATELPEESPTLTPTPAPSPTSTAGPSGLNAEGLLPILSRSKKESAKNKIAITVDDCNSAQNVRAIMDLAEQYGAHLTFFPLGQNVKKNPDLWREVYERGFEIENHSYTHPKMSEISRAAARNEIVSQSEAVNAALGGEYEMHFFRPPEGNSMKAEWLHEMLDELGYRALASWSLSGTQNSSNVLKALSSGKIVLFHATDKDVARLEKVIPGAIEQGFELVTVNELYDQEANVLTVK